MKKHIAIALGVAVLVGLLALAHTFDFLGMMKRLHGA